MRERYMCVWERDTCVCEREIYVIEPTRLREKHIGLWKRYMCHTTHRTHTYMCHKTHIWHIYVSYNTYMCHTTCMTHICAIQHIYVYDTYMCMTHICVIQHICVNSCMTHICVIQHIGHIRTCVIKHIYPFHRRMCSFSQTCVLYDTMLTLYCRVCSFFLFFFFSMSQSTHIWEKEHIRLWKRYMFSMTHLSVSQKNVFFLTYVSWKTQVLDT